MATGKDVKRKATVLVVDDDKNTRDGLNLALKETHNVILSENGEKALEALADRHVDIMLGDVRMPGMDGLTLMKKALSRNPELIVILLTAYGNVETAVEAMKLGAYDFLMKPVNLDRLDLLLQRALRSREVESENVALRRQLDDKYGLENIIGFSKPMTEVFDVIKQAAPTRATVMIQGESGTGKELVAHAIHGLSPRARGPFVAVHCAALTPSLLESELFGHEKGAFTGAVSRRSGRFEMADGGTLFLDEVSEIDPSVQVKLLRVLEERKFERVGGVEEIGVDIRLIAATNKDLRAMVKEGSFREDLFFRLDVVDINLPPLRERVDDIPILCRHFLRDAVEKDGKQIEGITSEALNLLASYDWPGNVRELRNTIEKMVVLAQREKLTARDVPPNIRKASQPGEDFAAEDEAGGVADNVSLRSGRSSLAEVEKKMIFSALEKHSGSRTEAAKELGISRRTLHRKLRRYQTTDNQD